MKILLNAIAALALAATLASCSGLTKEAKQMVGDYYIPEVSADSPLMELKGNGHCVMRAVRPGLIAYQVPGRWNVRNDSLVVDLKPDQISWEGDSTLIGTVATHIARRIKDFNGTTLTLEQGGADYVYFRRGHIDD